MVQEPSRPPPPRPMWTVTIIKDMVLTDAPNIKDCIILGPGSAILFFGHHQEPMEGLYLHEAQELAEVMMKTTTWMGQPTHQMVYPIMIALSGSISIRRLRVSAITLSLPAIWTNFILKLSISTAQLLM